MRISVFLGAPGSGKGTQAKKLIHSLPIKHLSTGDMLRAAMTEGTEVGLKAKAFVDKGELVPDDVMIELIQDALKKLPSSQQVILDGFPRTLAQAKALDASAGLSVYQTIMFEVPEPILIRRLTGRRVCKKCGSSFHTEFLPFEKGKSCNDCTGEYLYQRPDDSENVVGKRLAIFNSQNQDLLDYYSAQNKLKTIDGDKPVDFIQASLVKLFR